MSVEARDPAIEEEMMPGAADVEDAGSASWRLAKGKIVRGPKDKIEEMDPQKIVGKIVRCGVHEDVTNDQYKKVYKQFEIDVETRDGIVSLHASLWDNEKDEDRPSGSAVSIGVAAIEVGKNPGAIYQLTATKGDDWTDPSNGKLREGSTYLNLSIVTKKDDKWVAERIRTPKRDESTERTSYSAKWAEILPAIKDLPFYKERPKRGGTTTPTNPNAGLEAVDRYAAKNNLAGPSQKPIQWLAFMAKVAKVEADKTPKASLAGWPDSKYLELAEALEKQASVPKVLVDMLEVDPFAGTKEEAFSL